MEMQTIIIITPSSSNLLPKRTAMAFLKKGFLSIIIPDSTSMTFIADKMLYLIVVVIETTIPGKWKWWKSQQTEREHINYNWNWMILEYQPLQAVNLTFDVFYSTFWNDLNTPVNVYIINSMVFHDSTSQVLGIQIGSKEEGREVGRGYCWIISLTWHYSP